jgi:23S rRNA (guanine745-N1)-methyltransferase
MPELERHGLDLSSAALELAARASPQILFVVANADRFLPYAEGSFDFVTSIDARLNAREFGRILKTGGLLLVAAPSSDDLIELREAVQGGRIYKSRGARIEEELRVSFALLDRLRVREQRVFDPSALRDLLLVTYRGLRRSEQPAIDALTEMTVTLSHEILMFERV